MDEALGLPPIPYEPKPVVVPEPISTDADLEFARVTTYAAIAKLGELLDGGIDVARISQHPRAYEVAGEIANKLVQASRHLVALKKDAGGDIKDDPKTINNTLVLTSKEMLELMKNKVG